MKRNRGWWSYDLPNWKYSSRNAKFIAYIWKQFTAHKENLKKELIVDSGGIIMYEKSSVLYVLKNPEI